MRYRTLGRTGLKVSVLSVGSHVVNDEALNYALDKGVNLIVTSAAYKVAEEKIGNAVGHRRDDYHIATTTDHRYAKGARKDIKNSFKFIKTDYIDVYMVGALRVWRDETIDRVLAPGGAIEPLREAKREGRIGCIGLTGHDPAVLATAIKLGNFDIVFFVLNLAFPFAVNELIPLCKEMNVGTMVMRPLSHGALKPAEKGLRFALSSGADTVVSGMYTKETIDENLAIAEPEPTEEEFQSLMEMARSIDTTGCRLCYLCLSPRRGAATACPQGIEIPQMLTILDYRRRYGLLPEGEAFWAKTVEAAKKCDMSGECEKRCPYHIPVLKYVSRIAETGR